MPEPYDPAQPLWKEGYLLFHAHPALKEDEAFNRTVRKPYSFCITQMYRDRTTVRTV